MTSNKIYRNLLSRSTPLPAGREGQGVGRFGWRIRYFAIDLKFVFLLAVVLIFVATGCKKASHPYYPVAPPVVYDIDSNLYHTVTIGSQAWLVENLRMTRYRNGDPIRQVTDSTDWATTTTGAYCNYWNLEENIAVYGRLYNGHAISDSRNICPAGWHIPSESEWTILTDYFGGESISGGKLKETGFDHWAIPNTDATDVTGFTALPAGYRNEIGLFGNQHFSAIFWSSTRYDSNHMWYRYMYYNYGGMYKDFYHDMQHGFSVRCVYDKPVGDPRD